MKIYSFLTIEYKKKFDAMVLSLLLRKKSLSDAVKMTEKAIVKQLFNNDEEMNENLSLFHED